MTAKTLTFGLMHVTIAFLVVWALTGSPAISGAVALIEPLVNTLGYAVHERLWARRQITQWPMNSSTGVISRRV